MYRRQKSLRLQNFNYKSTCVYFITVCVNQHLCLFGEVNDKKLKLNDAGKMIASIFINLPKYYTGMELDTYIVMPDHFHGIITIDHTVGASLRGRPDIKDNIETHTRSKFMTKDNFKLNIFKNEHQTSSIKGRALRPTPTGDIFSLGEIIGRFKSYTTTQYIKGVENKDWKPFYEKLWQRGYYDHIIRNQQELYAIRKYIINNPISWDSDNNNPGKM